MSTSSSGPRPKSARKAVVKAAGAKGRSNLPDGVSKTVWIRAAGVCSRPGCGVVLHEDPQLLTPRRFGELAHNIGARPGAARGDPQRSAALEHDPDNLILLCPTCHTIIDKDDGIDYPEALLREWKLDHERNVRIAASFTSGQKAIPVLVSGPIGQQVIGIDPREVMKALQQAKLLPATEPQTITLPKAVAEPGEPPWWQAHLSTLRHQIERIISLDGAGNFPLAIFPLAEMPVLMAFGQLLGDKRQLLPFQFWRSSGSWAFQEPGGAPAHFELHIPDSVCPGQPVALALSLSSTVEPARVHAALGRSDIPIAILSTPHPGTDLVRCRETVVAFQHSVRLALDAIEQRVGDRGAIIHVFPIMPAPLAVAFGASVMPKVSNPLQIYDARGSGGPFQPAVRLPL